MKKEICALGIIIIIASLFIFASYETVTETVENPAWREWVLRTAHWETYESDPEAYVEFFGKAPEPPGAEPSKWLNVEHRIYRYTIVGAIILLIGIVTVFIGLAIPQH